MEKFKIFIKHLGLIGKAIFKCVTGLEEEKTSVVVNVNNCNHHYGNGSTTHHKKSVACAENFNEEDTAPMNTVNSPTEFLNDATA